MKKVFFLLALLTGFQSFAQLQRFSFSQPKMGSPFTIIFYATDSVQAKQQATNCYQLVDSLNAILSDYDLQSETSRLRGKAGSGEWISVSPVLSEVLRQSATAWQKSSGAVDVTMGPLSKLWRGARKTKIFLEKEDVLQTKKQTGFKHILLDTVHQRVQLVKEGMQLDFGAVAKGYIAQKLIDHL
ncbi:MAG TPA: FAD:protein FMN transferase [Flavisolibacter sp.]|nr:FAD:protein FMN transferase [Flavisolibacter sp.]